LGIVQAAMVENHLATGAPDRGRFNRTWMFGGAGLVGIVRTLP